MTRLVYNLTMKFAISLTSLVSIAKAWQLADSDFSLPAEDSNTSWYGAYGTHGEVHENAEKDTDN